jgi:hypothetical protein
MNRTTETSRGKAPRLRCRSAEHTAPYEFIATRPLGAGTRETLGMTKLPYRNNAARPRPKTAASWPKLRHGLSSTQAIR